LEQAIVESLKRRFLGTNTINDMTDAISLANLLLFHGVQAESTLEDCVAAEMELSRQVPGFSQALYSSIIGDFGYVNR